MGEKPEKTTDSAKPAPAVPPKPVGPPLQDLRGGPIGKPPKPKS
jgi:hypothetical protein